MMNDVPNPPMPPPPPAPMMEPPRPTSMFQMWMNALTKPNERTYAEIAGSPRASSTNAFLWVFIATLVQFFFSFLVGNAAQNQILRQFGGENLPRPEFGSRALTLICGAPIAAVVAVIGFALFVGIVHLIARAFNGRATFDRLAYTMAAIIVPVNLIGAVLSLLAAIPLIGLCFVLISILFSIYVVVVEVIAVKAVEQIGGGQAAVSVLALPIVLGVCVACALIIGLVALGPVIGNVFSSINQSLQGVP